MLAEPSVFVVADGMGGHQAGDVASRMVADRFARLAGTELRAMDEVVDTIGSVNQAILDQGRQAEDRSGMGTTAVGIILVDDGAEASFLLFNIGDSRAYCFADGELQQLSVDHSYVQELVDAGQLTTAAAREHPQRNVVTRALGVDQSPRADYWLRKPQAAERYLLCSDGLSSELDDAAIRAILAEPLAAAEAAATLVQQALDAGGRDNVSVLVLDVTDVRDEAAELTDTAPKGLIAALGVEVPGPAAEPAHAGEQPLLDVGVVPTAERAEDSTSPEPRGGRDLIDAVPCDGEDPDA